MKIIRLAVIGAAGVMALLLLAGHAEAAAVRLYWPGWGFLMTASVEVDGKHRAWIAPGKQVQIPVPPGSHKVAVREPMSFFAPSITVALREGETKYARVSRDFIAMGFNSVGPFPVMGMSITKASAAQAQSEMSGRKKKVKAAK